MPASTKRRSSNHWQVWFVEKPEKPERAPLTPVASEDLRTLVEHVRRRHKFKSRNAYNIKRGAGGARPAWRPSGRGYRTRPCRPGAIRFSLRAQSLRLWKQPFAPASVQLDEWGTHMGNDDSALSPADFSGDAHPAWLDAYGSNADIFSDHSFAFGGISSSSDNDAKDDFLQQSAQPAAPPAETEER